MNLFIDNNDGLGEIDYSDALLQKRPLSIKRQRGTLSICYGGLDVRAAQLPLPQKYARVRVSDSAGNILFLGFLQADARPAVSEATSSGTEEEPIFQAVEQAWLTGLQTSSVLQPATAKTCAARASDVEIEYAMGSQSTVQDLATDVTVEGGEEAADYVTELFRGDGTTQTFALAHAPFRASGVKTILSDSFDDAALNTQVWVIADAGKYLGLGGGGLQLSGGNGFDGATLLQYSAPIEMGGSLIATASGVQMTAGSEGLLLGFYSGSITQGNCIAGIKVRGTAGAHALVAVVNGIEQARAIAFADGHFYTLRVRLHCAEMQRVREVYSALVDGVLQQFGGDVIPSSLRIVMEVADLGLASNTLPAMLFDGALSTSPGHCSFALVNSTQMTGNVGKVILAQTGSAWVVSTAPDGTLTTRREGPLGTGADYALSSTGFLAFDPGRVPQPGDLVTVQYRRSQRCRVRMQDASSEEFRQQQTLPGLSSWSGTVMHPATRTSADCRNAAKALLALATGDETGRAGRVSWERGVALSDDVSPGDILVVLTTESSVKLVLQSVTIVDGNADPELLTYQAEFSQSRTESLSFRVRDRSADDPPQAIEITPDVSGLPAPLAGLQVTSATGAALQIDSGVDAAPGGGFEVRRSDANFGSANLSDLVLNSPVRSFSIPRQSFSERFFVRAYDGSTPRNYSPLASVVLTSLPLS